MKHSAFDLNLLKVLNALFEERSVTKAGERLGRTQSAISNSLKKLREQMHDPLFVRGAAGLELTPKAKSLEEQVRAILQMTEVCLADPGKFDPSLAKGKFRIGAPDRLSLPVMLPLMKTLQALAPNIAVDLVTVDRGQALDLLDSDQLDAAVGWFDEPPVRFQALFLFREALLCLCRKDHPILEIDPPLDLDAVLRCRHLIVSAAGDRKAAFDVMLERLDKQRDAGISLSNFSMVPSMLRETDLVGVFTQRVAEFLAKNFDLGTFPIPTPILPLDHYLVWHHRYDADQKHRWLREQIIREAMGPPVQRGGREPGPGSIPE